MQMSRVLVARSHANVEVAGSCSGLLIGAVGKTHLDVEDLAIMRRCRNDGAGAG